MIAACTNPSANNSDVGHALHDETAVCWTAVRLQLTAFRHGVPAKVVCGWWDILWEGN